jgi:hypothetical protein
LCARGRILLRSSVADPGCLSRFPDPDFIHPRTRDPTTIITTAEQKGEKLFVIPYLFYGYKSRKIVNYSILNRYRKKFEPIDKEL